MSAEQQELPEIGEIVIATITKISDHGAYVTLDEYEKIQGFLHVSEIAPGWVRKVNKYVKEGEKKVLLVKKVGKVRKEIDLSLKQISKDQRKKKLLDVKRFEKEHGILKNIQEKAELTTKQMVAIEGAVQQVVNDYDFSDTDNYEIDYGIDYDGKVHCESHEISSTYELVEMITEEVHKLFKEVLDTTEDDNHPVEKLQN